MPRRTRKPKPQPVAPPPPPPPMVAARVRLFCALGGFVALLIVYRLTVIPTMVDQDSGELVAAAHTLGIAHPTGYPLWTMLGRLFDLLPLGGTSAYRVAMLSAVAAAAAGGLLTWLVIGLTGAARSGLFAGLAFGLWFPTWSQAVRAEVYTISGLLFALFLLALFHWDRERSRPSLALLALAAGFISMHHRTAFLAVLPPLMLAFWLTRPQRVRRWWPGALLFLLPFLCYLYLPIRAAARPTVNWTNPVTWDRFLTHALGKQYTHFALMNWTQQPEVAGQQAIKLLGESLASGVGLSVLLALIGLPLILWGYSSLHHQRREVALSLALGSALLIFWVLGWGEVTDLKVFLLPLGALLALWGGFGLARLEQSKPRGRVMAATAGAAVTALLLVGNWARADQSGIWQHRDRWVAALSQMDRSAIFVSDFDVPSFATLYLQNVEGLRRDITLLRTVGMMQPWYVELIGDEELRDTASAAWQQTSKELGITASGTPQFWEGSARFAWRLAQHYRGRRPVYALHGPMASEIPGPPYFVGLSEDLVRLDFSKPDLLREDARPALATFPGGVELVSFAPRDRDQVPLGTMVTFTTRWRISSPPSGWFAVALTPGESPPSDEFVAQGGDGRRRSLQSFPFLLGQRDLPANPPGTVYEQQVAFIVPTNAPEPNGEWMLRHQLQVGFSLSTPPRYADWTVVGTLGTLRQSDSYPTNPP